jgi:ATP-dependent RNA helicase RhlE
LTSAHFCDNYILSIQNYPSEIFEEARIGQSNTMFKNRRKPFGSRSSQRGGGQRRAKDLAKFSIIELKDLIRNHNDNLKKVKEVKVEEVVEETGTFSDLNLHPKLLKQIKFAKYEKPTAIQSKAIPRALEGKDIVGISHTGSGKTAAFLIPMLNDAILKEEKSGKKVQETNYLIITPTRELATQIEGCLTQLGIKYLNKTAVSCIGGVSIYFQEKNLKRKPNFIVATPGRLIDLHKRGSLDLSNITHVVMDEVDQMFDMGFINDVKEILGLLPPSRQSFFFSATFNNKVETLIKNFLHEPVTINTKKHSTNLNIEQHVVQLEDDRRKLDYILDSLKQEDWSKTIIFSNTKRSVDKINSILVKHDYAVDCIHGDKSQSQRQRAVDKFKKGKIQLIVATSVAARGLDIDDVSHVVNFELPLTSEEYMHRIGRTARADKKGVAITLI